MSRSIDVVIYIELQQSHMPPVQAILARLILPFMLS